MPAGWRRRGQRAPGQPNDADRRSRDRGDHPCACAGVVHSDGRSHTDCQRHGNACADRHAQSHRQRHGDANGHPLANVNQRAAGRPDARPGHRLDDC
ncbi:hypothetical protein [Candidatus Amarolinea dominans]|uniref:hypothetical protein n=1 Tax=Candidatus Amarolinea dominans TaxID=3140696 RepID=UPI001E1A0703|nr:hypothetical protein [Anaerolineae bacterium]